jgi:glucose/mannose-6-phosphate isomerase
MGGSAIGGDLLKDWARNKASIPIEVSRDYTLPDYAGVRSLVVVASYSGDTEESLSAFLDSTRRKSMVFCVSSGGSLIEFAEKLGVPFLRVPGGMPPRAAFPYMCLPLFGLLEKLGLVSGVSGQLHEAIKVLGEVTKDNAPAKPLRSNPAKILASGIGETTPFVYGFGFYRGIAHRFKQQFNENAKVPSKWEVFPELDHNEIVGWEKAGNLARHFSGVFLRDRNEADQVRSRIEITKTLIQPIVSKVFEVWSQGRGELAKMLSTVLLGDFTSVYLAVLRNVDPTPVQTINVLKQKLNESGTKETILRELKRLSRA